MIKKIKVEHMGRITSAKVSCKGITLLTGPNGSGKTTVVEALGIAATAAQGPQDVTEIAEDVKEWYIYKLGYMPSATITLYTEDECKYTMKLNGCTWQTEVEIPETGTPLPEFGVRMVYPFHAPIAFNFNMLSTVLHGLCEHAPRELIVEGTGKKVIDQVNYWSKRLTGIEVRASKSKDGSTKYICHRASGDESFELLYAGEGMIALVFMLSGCILSKKEDILYVNHPESFLDAATQSKLINFFAYLANAGRQVFIETQSDHIFNSIRVGFCKGNLSPAKVAVNYLRPEGESNTIMCSEVDINECGDLMTKQGFLDGFFDQFDKDIDAMVGL